MEKLRTILSRKYHFLTTHRYHVFNGHKEYEQSLILSLVNNGGSICFTFTDLSSNETTTFDNPDSGDYVIPLKKGGKTKMVITSNKAIGSYKIVKKTIKG